MTDPHAALRDHAVRRLDTVGREHPRGHQPVHARRYLVPRSGGGEAEVVLIVKPETRLQVWCERDALAGGIARANGLRERPGSETYAKRNGKGDLLYGRHSSLKVLDRLHRGDAWHGTPDTTGAFDRVLEGITGRAGS